jgi:hypothetical protein
MAKDHVPVDFDVDIKTDIDYVLDYANDIIEHNNKKNE